MVQSSALSGEASLPKSLTLDAEELADFRVISSASGAFLSPCPISTSLFEGGVEAGAALVAGADG